MATGTGNLPNPSMSFSPFAILTAEEMNNLVENIESLATGSGIGDGSIPTAAIADGAVTPEKLLAGTGTTWPWQSWTPTWTNFTVGSGVVTAFYKQIGKTVNFRLRVKLNGSTMGTNPRFTLPVSAFTGAGDDEGYIVTRNVRILDAGIANYNGMVKITNSVPNSADIFLEASAGAYVSAATINSTTPMTWGNNDVISIIGMYEAA